MKVNIEIEVEDLKVTNQYYSFIAHLSVNDLTQTVGVFEPVPLKEYSEVAKLHEHLENGGVVNYLLKRYIPTMLNEVK